MKTIYMKSTLLILAFTAILALNACQDDVNLPRPSIALGTDSIIAPAIAADFSLDIEANCDWIITTEGNDNHWANFSQTKATGMAKVTISAEENTTGAARQLIVKVTAGQDASVVKTMLFKQASDVETGYISIADLRQRASNGSYQFAETVKVKGIVASNIRSGNYFENRIALQGSSKSNSGITLCNTEELLVSQGDEIEIDLAGASIQANAETGILELIPASKGKVARTVTSPITLMPLRISHTELISGDYESMYVAVNSQVTNEDVKKESVAEGLVMQTETGEKFPLYVMPHCQFASHIVPTGSGNLAGIAVPYEATVAIMPCTEENIALTSTRFDSGLSLPYVFSLMTSTGANEAGKYIHLDRNSSDVRNSVATTLDGTNVTLVANLTEKDKYFHYWNDNSGHHNFPIASWLNGTENYLLFTFPNLGEDLSNGFRFTFGMGVQKNAPANWLLYYSVDNNTWYSSEAYITIPKGKNSGGGKHFFYHTIDVPTPAIPLERKTTLYIRLAPYNDVSLSGGSISNSYGRVQFHSCAVLDHYPIYSTTKPSDAVYFEAFDGLTGGVDYRLGDKLSAMLNYCGNELAAWHEGVKNNLTGSNVYQRPGYAQIGYVETQLVNQNDYTNAVGVLETPALGVAGTLNLSFKAMAYHNTSVHQAGNNTAKDINGDLRSIVVEVIGGGTIEGKATKTVEGLNYSSFQTFNLAIEGATAETRLRFTSAPAEGEFSRWFIDNICVTK